MVTVIALLAGPDGGSAPVVLDPVLAPAAAQFSPGPAESDCAQRICGDLRLPRGRAVYRRHIGRPRHRQLSPASGQRCARFALCQLGPAGVFRRPPGAFHPGRCDHARGGTQHPGGGPRRAIRWRPGRTPGAGVGGADRLASFGVCAVGASSPAARPDRRARCLPAASAPRRRTRGRRHDIGLDLGRLAARSGPRPAGVRAGLA